MTRGDFSCLNAFYSLEFICEFCLLIYSLFFIFRQRRMSYLFFLLSPNCSSSLASLSLWLDGATHHHHFDSLFKTILLEKNNPARHLRCAAALPSTASGTSPVSSRRLLAVGAGNCNELRVILKLTAAQTWNIWHENIEFSKQPETIMRSRNSVVYLRICDKAVKQA